jgi:hypothetical protein
MPILKRSKSEDKMTEGLGIRELPRVVTPKQLVERGLNYLSEEEAVELFKEHYGEKYTIKKQKDTGVKEETDGGGSHDEEEEWNKQIRQKRDKIEATILEHYASQLNKSLETRMKELTKKMEEIHTSFKEGLYTQNGGEHNQTNRWDDTFETKRTNQKEGYRKWEYDEQPMEQLYRRTIGLSLDQMISQIPTFDGNP